MQMYLTHLCNRNQAITKTNTMHNFDAKIQKVEQIRKKIPPPIPIGPAACRCKRKKEFASKNKRSINVEQTWNKHGTNVEQT